MKDKQCCNYKKKKATYRPVAATVVLPDGHSHRHLLTRLPVFFAWSHDRKSISGRIRIKKCKKKKKKWSSSLSRDEEAAVEWKLTSKKVKYRAGKVLTLNDMWQKLTTRGKQRGGGLAQRWNHKRRWLSAHYFKKYWHRYCLGFHHPSLLGKT